MATTTRTSKATRCGPTQLCTTVGIGAAAVTTCVTTASVQIPQNAASAHPNDCATFASTLGALGSQFLKVDLSGTGLAGNRAGMVVGPGDGLLNGGLLDVNALQNFTLATYDAAGNLLESAAAGGLLSIGVLPDGRDELSFLTTRPFASVRLDVANGVAALSGMKVYYAFADDPQTVLPPAFVPAPLPVVLTDSAGRRTATGVSLTWAAASEHNSGQFVVERRADTKGEFQAVGQVAAAGNSTAAHRYQLADAGAAALAAGLYYRLRQVDLDGTTAYSPVVVLAASAQAPAGSLQVHPNPAPAAAPVTLRFGAAAGSAAICSELGQLVRRLPLPAAAGASLALPTLPGGLYHVVVRDGTGRQVAAQRLVVGQ